jgi:hypothetical protein
MECLCTAETFMQRHESTARNDLESMKLQFVSVYCSNMTEIGWDIIYQSILKKSPYQPKTTFTAFKEHQCGNTGKWSTFQETNFTTL